MDSLIAAAGRALAVGDALGALKRVGLRDDPPALALRGIAMAQFGEHPRARELLRRAARGFGAREELARARCVVAEAEVALAMRDLGGAPRTLAAAAAALEARADRANALHARLIAVRRLLLVGRLDAAPPRREAVAPVNRRVPVPLETISRAAACANRKPPKQPIRQQRSSASGASSSTEPRSYAPALNTATLGTPISFSTRANSSPTSTGSATSHCRSSRSLDWAASASRLSLSVFRATATTLIPARAKRLASAQPRPGPTPAITAIS